MGSLHSISNLTHDVERKIIVNYRTQEKPRKKRKENLYKWNNNRGKSLKNKILVLKFLAISGGTFFAASLIFNYLYCTCILHLNTLITSSSNYYMGQIILK